MIEKADHIDPQLQADFINEVLTEWAQEIHVILLNQLREKMGSVPNETISNLRYKVMKASAIDLSAKFELFFQDSGRHVDMKQLRPGQRLPVDMILEWVKRKGLKAFRKVPGYPGGKISQLDEGSQLQRIASAIAIAKAKGTIRRGKKRKKSQWLNPYFYTYYNKLIGRMISQQSDFLIAANKGEITQVFDAK